MWITQWAPTKIYEISNPCSSLTLENNAWKECLDVRRENTVWVNPLEINTRKLSGCANHPSDVQSNVWACLPSQRWQADITFVWIEHLSNNRGSNFPCGNLVVFFKANLCFQVLGVLGSLFLTSLFVRHPEENVNVQYCLSSNFSSACKGPFLTGKAKNICQRHTFLGDGGGGGRWGEGHGPILLGKVLGAN